MVVKPTIVICSRLKYFSYEAPAPAQSGQKAVRPGALTGASLRSQISAVPLLKRKPASYRGGREGGREVCENVSTLEEEGWKEARKGRGGGGREGGKDMEGRKEGTGSGQERDVPRDCQAQ